VALGYAPSPAARKPQPQQRPRRWPLLIVFGLIAATGLAAAAVFELSGLTLTRDAAALARVEIQPLGGNLQAIRATDPEGRHIALTETDGLVELLEGTTAVTPGATVGFLSYAALAA